MLRLSKILGLAALVSTACAHFTLDYPQTRGFDEDLEPQFCGGFPFSNRSLFPLSAGAIEIDSHHTSSVFVTLISFDQNPQNFSQFSTAPDGQSIPYLKPFIQLSGTGEMCVPVNVSALGIQGVGNGTNATIMVQFNGGDGELYQCADITLSTDPSIPIRQCTNTSTFVAIEGSNDTSSVISSTTKSDALSTSPLTSVAGLSAVAALLAFFL